MMSNVHLFILGSVISLISCSQKKEHIQLEWEVVTQIPAVNGESEQIGLAGLAGGVHNNALILAGGANFPDSMPWKGGKKKYWSDIFVLLKDQSNNLQWLGQTFLLPKPLAYSASVSLRDGVLSIGGENAEGIQSDVLLLKWDASTKKVSTDTFPSLPIALTNASAAVAGNVVYVAGGQSPTAVSNKVFTLDLSSPTAWKEAPKLPVSLTHAVAVVQSNGSYPCLYIIGGRRKTSIGISDLYSTVYEFDTRQQKWNELPPISTEMDSSITLSAATGVAIDDDKIYIFGGDRGNVFSKIERLDTALAAAKDSGYYNELMLNKVKILTEHQGFSRAVYSYNTVTKTWAEAGSLPISQVTTFAVKWGDNVFIPSGEIKPGVRTAQVLKGSIK